MKILITSGGTTEEIDRVRGITNHATGALGSLIAQTFLDKGHDVTLVTTKQAIKPSQHPNLTVKIVSNVNHLKELLEPLVKTQEAIIHSMAVSDYSPIYMTDLESVCEADDLTSFLNQKNTETKISSDSDYQVLFLKKTPKIISHIKIWNPDILLIGFKLLVNVPKEELFCIARESLRRNQADYILANDLAEIDTKRHHAYLLTENTAFEAHNKKEIAQLIYEKVVTHD
ncbi:phosphopantothenate--cysteine ligase [Streptococcus sciuri]|uniref:Phosphopantothenate--cysteine ligase n=1 Tax=Streptococcus sciuri TaxID=2973939 RepID=A0ABT2F5H2_9STRE|nr:phosphopantothenate--cysteine ligase [Streptococcus sciuri]MCS4487682.1 phosphopantothenate--cysteine ligase [Streptococcus sciuri]